MLRIDTILGLGLNEVQSWRATKQKENDGEREKNNLYGKQGNLHRKAKNITEYHFENMH